VSGASADPTPWESLVTTVVNDLIESLPDIVRNGYTRDGISVPPYADVTLPDIQGFDSGQKPPLCPTLSKAEDTTRLSALGVHLTGLDTVVPFSPLTFPVQDIELSIPLVFSDIAVRGRWESHTPCAKESEQPIDTVHDGTFVVHFTSVQITIDVKLDATASSVTAATIALTDANGAWPAQPVFDAETDITFDKTTTQGKIAVIRSMLQTSQFLTALRDPTRRLIEGPDLSHALRTVIEDVISSAL
jgi:hypothetical protein